MSRILGLASLTLAGLVAQASAMDDLGGFVDMRLGYDTLGTAYSLNYGTVDTDDSWQSAHRINLDWIGSLGLSKSGGMLWGLGGSWVRYNGELPRDEPATLQYWVVRGQLGYGFPLGESMQLELLPYLGFGRSYLRIRNQPHDNWQSGNDATWEAGANVNLVHTWENGFQFGLQAGGFYYESSVLDEESDQRYRFGNLNIQGGAFIGARL